ncbi:FkbH-like protein [Granulicella aggregans]|uniref:FkbH-like protein n=1 Tax=Granulicella aggregans TaxID=474949 RepID=A0A7W7ZH88_9BACT|nr:HAD-IIIC family phosphatase [Granulicella aggregans]MBB5059904.1 FkbH-like protein [Granulicella aggregans]
MPPEVASIETASVDRLILKRRRFVRELRANAPVRELRIAVLGGTTTNEVVDFLEIHLLVNGFNPIFYQSEFGRFYEDAVYDTARLAAFRPELVYVHTCYRNITSFPPLPSTEEDHRREVDKELERFRQIWQALNDQIGCQIIQNNFELPPISLMGNMDAVVSGGRTRFLLDLNAAFAAEARQNPRLLIQDIQTIASRVGLPRWFDWDRWFSYKILYTPEGNLAIARSLNAMIKSMYGMAKKVLVLDLDNTLWGGVIGDDGVDKIQIGRETPLAEAYTAFQQYCLDQRKRGVLLAVCSKNNDETARGGFSHPDSVLKLEHFSAFKANWEPKHENLLHIARDLNLGVDSFVFVDDNPAERHIVAAQIPGVAVPDVGSDVSRFIPIIDAGRYFEPISLSKEDFERAAMYANRAELTALESKFEDYGAYLDSMEMEAEIDSFHNVYLERISQLTNKTNQYNLTTRRCTLAEMESFQSDPAYVTLYGRLKDKFGDNGLVTVILGRKKDDELHLDLWLMSCRVLKRDMELAMLDTLVRRARAIGTSRLVGYYIPTKKNGMVADHYESLGFKPLSEATPEGATTWVLELGQYTPRNTHIAVIGRGHD